MNIVELERLHELSGKLTELLRANDLTCTFVTDRYPIVLSISRDMDPAEQLEMCEAQADCVSACDAKLDFLFVDGDVVIRVDKRLVIPDALLSKIKGLAKKMHYMYLQAYFHQCNTPFGLRDDPVDQPQNATDLLEPGSGNLLEANW